MTDGQTDKAEFIGRPAKSGVQIKLRLKAVIYEKIPSFTFGRVLKTNLRPFLCKSVDLFGMKLIYYQRVLNFKRNTTAIHNKKNGKV